LEQFEEASGVQGGDSPARDRAELPPRARASEFPMVVSGLVKCSREAIASLAV